MAFLNGKMAARVDGPHRGDGARAGLEAPVQPLGRTDGVPSARPYGALLHHLGKGVCAIADHMAVAGQVASGPLTYVLIGEVLHGSQAQVQGAPARWPRRRSCWLPGAHR